MANLLRNPKLDLDLGLDELALLLPQRPPMLMVDRVSLLGSNGREAQGAVEGAALTAHRTIDANEFWVAAHFPGAAVLPGVLLIEGLAQSGSLLHRLQTIVAGLHTPTAESLSAAIIARSRVARTPSQGVLAGCQIKFRQPVFPGDQLRYEVQLTRQLGDASRMHVSAHVGRVCVAEGHVDLSSKPLRGEFGGRQAP